LSANLLERGSPSRGNAIGSTPFGSQMLKCSTRSRAAWSSSIAAKPAPPAILKRRASGSYTLAIEATDAEEEGNIAAVCAHRRRDSRADATAM
jgi:hypothetical protein